MASPGSSSENDSTSSAVNGGSKDPTTILSENPPSVSPDALKAENSAAGSTSSSPPAKVEAKDETSVPVKEQPAVEEAGAGGESTAADGSAKAPPPPTAAEPIKLDVTLYETRLEKLWALWESAYPRTGSAWHKVQSLILLNGRQDDSKGNAKTTTFHLWLLGYEFPETLIVLTRDRKIFFLAGAKKLRHLAQLEKEGTFLLERNVEDNNAASLDKIKSAIIAAAGSEAPDKIRVGRLRGKAEEATGNLAIGMEKVLTSWGFEEAKMELAVSKLVNKLDNKGQLSVQKAGTFATALAKEILVNRVEVILDGELVESHESICKRAEQVLDDEKKLKDWKGRYGLNPELVDTAYVLVQSGTNFDLRAHALPSPENFSLGPGAIIIAVGSKYGDYTANVTRTLLLDATEEQKAAYQLALDVQTLLIKNLKPRTALKRLYEAGKALVEKKRPDFVSKMVRNLGHVIGIDFNDPLLTINGRNENVVEAGMAFNVSVGFSGVNSVKGNASSPTFAVWVADTVIVKADGRPLCVTESMKKSLEAIFYRFKEEGDDGPDAAAAAQQAAAAGGSAKGKGMAEAPSVRERLRKRRRGQGGDRNAEELLQKQLGLRAKKKKKKKK